MFDARTNDPNDLRFVRAFDVIRQFNEEAERQERLAQPGGFHRSAAITWLTLHQNSNQHFSPTQRSVNPAVPWTQDPNDVEALETMNRYCFRCHGTILYNLFDKKSVLDRKFAIIRHLNPKPADLEQCKCFIMPPDRRLDATVRDRLTQLIAALR